ncbi:hypothetical protein SODALDRAFT_175612 [Sodiomyces alkalinus F11]|uniref:Uncharacterized protein n=1 Tax=Sodiomyces alkalinus (strain CBS 110278 / VKM F-3762 / F11) TaxID=1314773 RepID=A0A3N2PTT8_SODAK|nr:hypothetical protein SODALDRAFT_175612 [Sodiomyces alkalinus F11]ROT37854.1 hypothetical protein SODALDRAFT_175612 [Sodiomyces alkalinus F11]
MAAPVCRVACRVSAYLCTFVESRFRMRNGETTYHPDERASRTGQQTLWPAVYTSPPSRHPRSQQSRHTESAQTAWRNSQGSIRLGTSRLPTGRCCSSLRRGRTSRAWQSRPRPVARLHSPGFAEDSGQGEVREYAEPAPVVGGHFLPVDPSEPGHKMPRSPRARTTMALDRKLNLFSVSV